MKHVVFMCLALYVHTTQSETLKHQSSTEGADVSLYCKPEGKVVWSKYRDGQRVEILNAEDNEHIHKPNPDPDNRYSVLSDLSLHIKKLSLSDSGIYYCNKKPTVNLTVTASVSDKENSTTSSYNQTGSTTATPVTSANTTSSSVDIKSNKTTSSYTDSTNSTQAPSKSTPTSGNGSHINSSSHSDTCTNLITTSETPSSANSNGPAGHTTPSQETTSSTNSIYEDTTSSRESSSIAAAVSGGVVTGGVVTGGVVSGGVVTGGVVSGGVVSGGVVTGGVVTGGVVTGGVVSGGVVTGGVVLVVLSLLLWTCIKRKALSNKNENIYETVEDGDLTAQPAPSQKLNDNVYYLAGDPNIVKLGQKTEDHTYTLISESQSIENITSQRPANDDSTYTLISGIQSKENITSQRSEIDDPTYTLISGIQ